MQPLVFEPYLRPMVWGGRKLGTFCSKSLPADGPYGESWELSPHPHHISRVAEGPLQGTSLVELCTQSPAEVFGPLPPSHPRFPLLIKLLDCHQLLSIQVHPTDALAERLAGETFGKTEAWVVLDVAPQAKIYSGFKPEVTREEVEQRLSDGTLEQTLHQITPRRGDCVFLPAGTVHAVGGGVLMAEVQQASDATFRLYDWNRPGPDGKPRTLHIEQALEAIDWTAGPVDPVTPNIVEDTDEGRVERLVDCDYFTLERVTRGSALPAHETGQLAIWMLLGGQAALRAAGGYERHFRPGETVLVPASAESPRWEPLEPSDRAQWLRITLPPH